MICLSIRHGNAVDDVEVDDVHRATAQQICAAAGLEPDQPLWCERTGVRLDDHAVRDLQHGDILADRPPFPGWELLLTGPTRSQLFPLRDRAATTIGRSDGSCDVRLDDPTVSRTHITVTAAHAVLHVRDERSSNGTFVDGNRVTEVDLQPGEGMQLSLSELAVLPPPRPDPVPAGGHVPFSPDARGAASVPTRTWKIDRIPDASPRRRFRGAYMIGGALTGVALAAMFGRWQLLIISAILPIGIQIWNHFDDKRDSVRDHERHAKDFDDRLEELGSQLEMHGDALRLSIDRGAPPSSTTVSRMAARSQSLWWRDPHRAWFSTVRIGLHSPPVAIDLPTETTRTDPEAAEKLASFLDEFTVFEDVPYTIDLQTTKSVSLTGPQERVTALGRWIAMQLAAHHSPRHVELAWFGGHDAETKAWTTWLPHVERVAGTSGLAVVRGESETGILNSILSRSTDDVALTVAFIDMGGTALTAGQIEDLVNASRTKPLAIVVLAPDTLTSPGGLNVVVTLSADGTGTLEDLRSSQQTPLTIADGIGIEAAGLASRAIASLRDPSRRAAVIPERVTLFDLLDATDTDGISQKWKETKEQGDILAPVGVGRDGMVQIAIGSTANPHAMVGGAASSGKSEFLRTWILAMAATYSPGQVNFLLFDLAGERSFGPIVGLPHVVGVVSTATPLELDRAARFLDAEIDRRGAAFKNFNDRLAAKDQAPVSNLTEARATFPDEAPPSFFVVVDEFAQIVRVDRKFLDKITTVAAAGRGWGIHAILATQSPDRHIDDTIADNVPVRVAFRLEKEAASQRLLDSPAAANITTVGRALARIDPRNVVELQAAYSSAPAVSGPSARLAGIKQEPVSDKTEAQLIIEQIQLAAGDTFESVPWHPSLPTNIPAEQLAPLGGHVPTDPVVVWGQADRPRLASSYNRPLFRFDPATAGGQLILGGPRTGKSSAMRALAYRLAQCMSPQDLEIVVIDFGAGRSLSPLTVLPHVLGYVHEGDLLSVHQAYRRLESELRNRGLAVASAGTSWRDIRDGRERPLPQIVVLIDGLDEFGHIVPCPRPPGAADWLRRLMTQGPSLGIVPIAAETNVGDGIGIGLSKDVADVMMFRSEGVIGLARTGMSDRASGLVGHLPTGRALVRSLGDDEVQFGLLTDGDVEVGSTDDRSAFEALASEIPRRDPAPHLPFGALPSPLQLADTTEPTLGVDELSLKSVPLVDGRGLLITGGPQSGKSETLAWIVEQTILHDQERSIVVYTETPDSRIHPRIQEVANVVIGAEAACDHLAGISQTDPTTIVIDAAPMVTNYENRETGNTPESALRLALLDLLTQPGEVNTRLLVAGHMRPSQVPGWAETIISLTQVLLLAPVSLSEIGSWKRATAAPSHPSYEPRPGFGVYLPTHQLVQVPVLSG